MKLVSSAKFATNIKAAESKVFFTFLFTSITSVYIPNEGTYNVISFPLQLLVVTDSIFLAFSVLFYSLFFIFFGPYHLGSKFKKCERLSSLINRLLLVFNKVCVFQRQLNKRDVFLSQLQKLQRTGHCSKTRSDICPISHLQTTSLLPGGCDLGSVHSIFRPFVSRPLSLRSSNSYRE